MPNLKSAAKALRQSKKRAARNLKVKTNLKTTVKKGKKALIAGEKEKAQKLVLESIRLLDKAAQKKVIKKNNASRKKSRLMKQLNVLQKKAAA